MNPFSNSKKAHALPWVFCFLFLATSLPSRAEDVLEEAKALKEKGENLFFSHTGIGAGWFLQTHFNDSDRDLSRSCVGFESKLGANLTDHLSLFLLSGVSVFHHETVRDYANWVFKKDDYSFLKVFFLMWFIPFAGLLDSQLVVGPGLAYHFSDNAPSFVIEAGGGLSSVQSVVDKTFLFGGGFFGGVGFDITKKIGFGIRVLWTPSFLFSTWTSSDSHVLSIMGMFHI
jgi:hypothetical protein